MVVGGLDGCMTRMLIDMVEALFDVQGRIDDLPCHRQHHHVVEVFRFEFESGRFVGGAINGSPLRWQTGWMA